LAWSFTLAPARAQEQPPAPPVSASPQAPAGQAPDQDQSSEDQAAQTPELMPVPELPKIPEVQMPGERGVSVGISLGNGNAKPELEKGSFPYAYLGNIRMAGNPKFDQSVDVRVPIGLHDVIWASYVGSRATGSVYAPSELGLITQVYLQGDYLDTDYRITSYRVGFDYLAWPYPVKTSRFRLKTTYEMQFLRARIGFDAPLVPTSFFPNEANSDLPSTYATSHTYQFYIPQFGLDMQYWLSRGVRLEGGGGGFSIPHHQNSWDFEGSINFRAGHAELRLGYRGEHFRTSALQDFWVRGTMVGPFIGLRFYTDSMTK
jgi:hypothetical protein